MKLAKMESIVQYRNIIKYLIQQSQFIGLDTEGNPLYNNLLPKPIVTFTGTIKLHGTNAGVSCDHKGNIWFQSKENIITPLKDNYGFAQFAENKRKIFENMFSRYRLKENDTLTIYGEWAGKGIQNGVAIAELEKSFFIFSAKRQTLDKTNAVVNTYYLTIPELTELTHTSEDRIYNIYDFKTYSITVNCEEPHVAQNTMIAYVDTVEKECPVAKQLGISGIGEGIVFTGYYKEARYIFKIKGNKHAGKAKVKTLNIIDEGKINLINFTVNKVLPAWRLDQFYNEIVGPDADRTKLGNYIRAILNDIVKEDLDTLTEAGLTIKDISKTVSEQIKKYFFERESL